jgi:DNA-binding transcriptional LysR family regulator
MLTSFHGPDLRNLRIFCSVVRQGGYAAAQTDLNVSAATISASVSQLEDRLGVVLCRRGPGGFALTGEGEIAFRAAERLFAAIEDFRTEVVETTHRMAGEVRIGFLDNIISCPDLPAVRLLGKISREQPGVRFRILVGSPAELETRLLDGHLHFAIGVFQHRLPELMYRDLVHEHHELFCGQSHYLFSRDDSTITQAELTAARYASREHWEHLPGLEPTIPFKSCASSSYVEGLAALVLSGEYIAYLPTHFAAQWVDRGMMRSIKPAELCRQASVHAAARSNGPATALQNHVWREFEKVAASMYPGSQLQTS